jgi:hypothetical protein
MLAGHCAYLLVINMHCLRDSKIRLGGGGSGRGQEERDGEGGERIKVIAKSASSVLHKRDSCITLSFSASYLLDMCQILDTSLVMLRF